MFGFAQAFWLKPSSIIASSFEFCAPTPTMGPRTMQKLKETAEAKGQTKLEHMPKPIQEVRKLLEAGGKSLDLDGLGSLSKGVINKVSSSMRTDRESTRTQQLK